MNQEENLITNLNENKNQELDDVIRKKERQSIIRRTFTNILHKEDKYQILFNYDQPSLGSNKIRTQKYTWYNFLPKNLFEQFSKPANLYFLLLSFLQMAPIISTTHQQPATLLPLSILIILTGIKDFYEDYKRQKSDYQENYSKCLKLQNGKFVEALWKDLHSGNIVKIKKDEVFPCDLLLLQSSNIQKKCCYVETKNLDGETNLKIKSILKQGIFSNSYSELEFINVIQDHKDVVIIEKENCNIHHFEGKLYEYEDEINLQENNILLRGCSLKNTNYIIGLVLYTGSKTKIMQNALNPHQKRSKFQKKIDLFIFYQFVIQILLCSFASFYFCLYVVIKKKQLKNWVYNVESNIFWMFILKLGNWILIFSTFVPISLQFTLEIIRLFQAFIISFDQSITHIIQQEQTQQKISCTVLNSALNETLGQVNIVFTDKTGTLTENKMKFTGMILNENLKLSQDVQQQFISQNKLFYYCLSLCHQIIFDENNNPNSLSQEELAIHDHCIEQQFYFQQEKIINENNKNKKFKILSIQNQIEEFKVLYFIEFSSERKQMSIIVQDNLDQIYLFTKGADDVIRNQLDQKSADSLKQIDQGIIKASNMGFRVMMLAYKKIDQLEWQELNKELQQVNQNKNYKKLLQKIHQKMEINLTILGGVMLEDKLQTGVKQTLINLQNRDIKIWMITGDKTETAIAVARDCGIIQQNKKVIILKNQTINKTVIDEINDTIKQKQKYSIVIFGQFFKAILSLKNQNYINYQFFFDLMFEAESIVFSRVTPKQKLQIVQFYKEFKKKDVTLAIGDGANDVNMITGADIGIGIKGLDGKQAARASDYSIGQFRYIQTLMLYYGSENFIKNSFVVFYILYKNMLVVLPQFWFGFRNFFSGQTLYETVTYQTYNSTATFFPIFFYGIFEVVTTREDFFNKKIFYKQAQQNKNYDTSTYIYYFSFAILISLFIQIGILSIMDNQIQFQGHQIGFWNYGNTIFIAVIISVNLKLLFKQTIFSIASLIGYVFSIVSFYLFWSFLSMFKQNDLYNTFFEIMQSPQNFVVLTLLIGICCLDFEIDYLIKKIYFNQIIFIIINMDLKTNKKVLICSDDNQFFEDLKNKIQTPDVKKWYNFEFIQNEYNDSYREQQILEIYQNTFSCDVFIYDMNNYDLELLELQIQIISSIELQTPKHFILISNILTWEKTDKIINQGSEDDIKSIINDVQYLKQQKQQKPQDDQQQEENDQQDEEQEENFQIELSDDEQVDDQQFKYLKANEFEKRKSNYDYSNFISIENLISALNKTKKNFKANIICPGIMYGYNQKQLFELFKISWLHEPRYLSEITHIKKSNLKNIFYQNFQSNQKITKISLIKDQNKLEQQEDSDQNNDIENEEENEEQKNKKNNVMIKNNEIPMIHYQDFLLYIKFILTQDFSDSFYVLSIDQNKKRTQRQIIKTISNGMNSGEVKKVEFSDCQYSQTLKRILLLDVKVIPSQIFDQYEKQKEIYTTYEQELLEIDQQKQEKLKEMEQNYNQDQEEQLEEEEEDLEIIKKREFVNQFKNIDYKWHNKEGICFNIQKIKQEFIEHFKLLSNKICILGPPFSGKTSLAKQLSEYFKLPIINKQKMIEKYKNIEDDFGEELKNYIEEKQTERQTLYEESLQKRLKQNKKNPYQNLIKDNNDIEIPFEMLIKMYKKELRNNIYTNRGYILDGFPETYKQFFYLFKINEQKEDEDEEAKDIDECKEIPEEIDQRFFNFQNFDQKILDKNIAPVCIIKVNVQDEEQELFFMNNQEDLNMDYDRINDQIVNWKEQFNKKEILQAENFAEEEDIMFIDIQNQYGKDISQNIISQINKEQKFLNSFIKPTQNIQSVTQKKDEMNNDQKENIDINLQQIKNIQDVIHREIELKIKKTNQLEFYEDKLLIQTFKYFFT